MGLGNPLEVVVHHLLSEGWLVLAIMMGFHGECTSVYGYTLDKTYGESWLKVIK